MDDVLKFYLPILKTGKDYSAILSDTSLDRDDELIDTKLINKWASDPNKYLPMLIDHKNEVLSTVGKWVSPQIITKDFGGITHTALSLKPQWALSNPNAVIIKNMIEQDGIQFGLSIGARPLAHDFKKVGDRKYKVHTDAELVEGSLTPVPANANCMIMAKSFTLDEKPEPKEEPKEEDKNFNVELTKPKEVEDCVKALMSDPEFKPQEGRTKEESAWAVCQSKQKSFSNINQSKEVITMPEDNKTIDKTSEILDLIKAQNEQIASLKKDIEAKNVVKLDRSEELKKMVATAPIASAPVVDKPASLFKMLKIAHGVKD
jgi:hypothetical protein